MSTCFSYFFMNKILKEMNSTLMKIFFFENRMNEAKLLYILV